MLNWETSGKVQIRKLVIIAAALGCLMLTSSCSDLFDYSPYLIDFDDANTDVNRKNIDRLKNKAATDTITIAFTGDTHNYFDELHDFVEKVNSDSRIDFVFHVGDIADFGLPKQYLWGNDYLSKLKVPYLVAIGNHDLVSNGKDAYEVMFGALDFSFVYQRIRFIFLNTNSREFAFNQQVPDLAWLAERLQPSNNFDKAVIICHVPPDDGDFDSNLINEFYATIAQNKNVVMLVHGHQHHHEVYFPMADSIPFVNVFGVEHRKTTIIKIIDNQILIDNAAF
ncbi:MAG TPA: metallophosphoesterase [Bacteroidales bacterium]|nr:metallophosphoesterase [Bacteroidales bacterium]